MTVLTPPCLTFIPVKIRPGSRFGIRIDIKALRVYRQVEVFIIGAELIFSLQGRGERRSGGSNKYAASAGDSTADGNSGKLIDTDISLSVHGGGLESIYDY